MSKSKAETCNLFARSKCVTKDYWIKVKLKVIFIDMFIVNLKSIITLINIF